MLQKAPIEGMLEGGYGWCHQLGVFVTGGEEEEWGKLCSTTMATAPVVCCYLLSVLVFFSLRDYDGMTKLSRLGCCRIYYLPT